MTCVHTPVVASFVLNKIVYRLAIFCHLIIPRVVGQSRLAQTPCDIRYCLYSLTINSFISTPSKSEILSKLLRSGCDELVHHFETVDGFTPNCSASHLLVRFFSTKTTFMRFISSITLFVCNKISDFISL